MMTMRKKILVPFDGSKPAKNTVKQAITMASNFSGHSEVIPLSVLEEVSILR